MTAAVAATIRAPDQRAPPAGRLRDRVGRHRAVRPPRADHARFLTEPNLRNILDQQSLVLIAASVATLTMIAGGFDVSQGAVYVVAPLLALWVENQTGDSSWGCSRASGSAWSWAS